MLSTISDLSAFNNFDYLVSEYGIAIIVEIIHIRHSCILAPSVQDSVLPLWMLSKATNLDVFWVSIEDAASN